LRLNRGRVSYRFQKLSFKWQRDVSQEGLPIRFRPVMGAEDTASVDTIRALRARAHRRWQGGVSVVAMIAIGANQDASAGCIGTAQPIVSPKAHGLIFFARFKLII
jgi:hypothetical protein